MTETILSILIILGSIAILAIVSLSADKHVGFCFCCLIISPFISFRKVS